MIQSSNTPTANHGSRPRVLVAIANHGTRNRRFLDQLLAEYRAMRRYDIKLVVNSDVPKDLGDDVEVRVGLPSDDPWSLPFAHKRLFAERRNVHDLYIYSEDDTLLKESHIDAFMLASRVLPHDRIAGFLRYEIDPHGRKYFSSMHSHYHWDVHSVRRHGDMVFARHTNDHAACYILTRAQLHRAIDSGGYLLPPVKRRYGMPETAATDPYTCCGMTKLVCISRLDDFCLHHLPNAYWQRLGLGEAFARLEIARLMSYTGPGGDTPTGPLIQSPPLHDEDSWNKLYYEPLRDDILAAVPKSARCILSVGCGNAATETALAARGHEVTAIPLDSVVAVSGEKKGVRILPANLELACELLDGSEFDCILLPDILQLAPCPVDFLKCFRHHLADDGAMLVSAPNWNYFGTLRQRMSKNGRARLTSTVAANEAVVHRTTRSLVNTWLEQAGLPNVRELGTPRRRLRNISRWSLGLADELLCERMLVLASR